MISNCPICGKKVKKPADKEKNDEKGAFFPFCSQRCKLVDLNRWFNSEYVISSPLEKEEKNDEEDIENKLE